MTQSTDKIDNALINIAKYEAEQDVHNAAEIVGIHLKGHLYLKIKLVLNIRNTLYVHLSIKLNIFKRLLTD